jgi:hypothetical protein
LGPHRCSIDLWQCIARCLRQHLRGWGANLGKLRREARDILLSQVKELDELADSSGLDEEGWAISWRTRSSSWMVRKKITGDNAAGCNGPLKGTPAPHSSMPSPMGGVGNVLSLVC